MTRKNSLLEGLKEKYVPKPPAKKKVDSNLARTENFAVTYKSSLNKVLDLFNLGGASRGVSLEKEFLAALKEDPLLSVVAALNIRDVRGGKGEREQGRNLLRTLYKREYELFMKIVDLVPYYGRWDDLLGFISNPDVVRLVAAQLKEDLKSEKPSLLGKWMPSENASSVKTRNLAKAWRKRLGLTSMEYRKMLSDLRAKIGIVERLMSAGDWKEIKFDKQVPSAAMKRYSRAFHKHDHDRFSAYLTAVTKGEKKMAAGAVYPYEVIALLDRDSKTAEAMWGSLPKLDTNWSVLPVLDGSGSMGGWGGSRGLTNVTPYNVAHSLGIYLAENNKEPWAGHVMTFSNSAKFIVLPKHGSLQEKVRTLRINGGEMGGTNLQSVFNTLLATAKKNKVPQSDMPDAILVVSDMEFNGTEFKPEKTNQEEAEEKFKKAGYKLPVVIYWSLVNRTKNAVALKDQMGILTLSGFSPKAYEGILRMDLDGVVDPYAGMLTTLLGERYAPAWERLLA